MTKNFQKNFDTIAAIATAPGVGAISIIRLSGSDTLNILENIFSKSLKNKKTHTIHFGKILDKNLKTIDSVLVLLMLNPNSYTGEDIVEIQCHGGKVITENVFQRVLDAGARPANPGEFTYRAFLNKKIDLVQAEAVQNLISANNELSLKASEKHLDGKLSKKIKTFQKELIKISAIIEAWIDFPEEDLEFISDEEFLKNLKILLEEMKNLLKTYDEGKVITSNHSIAIIGTPNVGKSSLMNSLLEKDRAIVTDIPGTTRDILEDTVKINDFIFHLLDTAGIRDTFEKIEKEGILRAKKVLKDADIVLLVLDSSKTLSEDDLQLIHQTNENNTIFIWNKIDIQKPIKLLNKKREILLSVKNNLGLDNLKNEIVKILFSDKTFSKEEVIITSKRHKNSLYQAIEFCLNAKKSFQNNQSPEFISSDIKESLYHLNKIIGIDITEDILSEIFSKFCVGK